MKKQGTGEQADLDDEEAGREMLGEAGELNFGQYLPYTTYTQHFQVEYVYVFVLYILYGAGMFL